MKELHMTFFMSKFHGTESISLGDILFLSVRYHDEIGGFVAWNTYKINKYPRKNTYEEYFRGGVTSNPITWIKSVCYN